MNALKEPFTLTLTQFSSADSISTHSRHLTSNINTFQAESNNNKSIHSQLKNCFTQVKESLPKLLLS